MDKSLFKQLFKTEPDLEIFKKVLACYNIQFEKLFVCSFYRDDMVRFGTIRKIYELKPELEKYYIPCKAKVYLNDIRPSYCTTVLRHFLRFFNYDLISTEKSICNVKHVIYHIVPQDRTSKHCQITVNNNPPLIRFD